MRDARPALAGKAFCALSGEDIGHLANTKCRAARKRLYPWEKTDMKKLFATTAALAITACSPFAAEGLEKPVALLRGVMLGKPVDYKPKDV